MQGLYYIPNTQHIQSPLKNHDFNPLKKFGFTVWAIRPGRIAKIITPSPFFFFSNKETIHYNMRSKEPEAVIRSTKTP
jgi:hypothetical protein